MQSILLKELIMGRMVQATIRNCKNIRQADISIELGSLNIKYAPNGTGKSSLADGVVFAITQDEALGRRIVPFEDRLSDSPQGFAQTGLDVFNSVEKFDEDYISRVVFAENTLFSDGFNVFVKTDMYTQTLHSLESILSEVKTTILDTELTALKRAVEGAIEGISSGKGLTKKNELAASAHAKKGLESGNPKASISPEYSPFSPFITTDRFEKWSKWHRDGEALLEEPESICPFCGDDFTEKRAAIMSVSTHYPSLSASHLSKLLGGIALAEEYFDAETKDDVSSIVNSPKSLTDAQLNYLAEIVAQASTIKTALDRGLQLGSFFHLASLGNDISSTVTNCKIDLSLTKHFSSEKTQKAVATYNSKLDSLLAKSGELLGIVNRQKDHLARSLEGYTGYINSFLSSAGYPYQIELQALGEDQCQVALKHDCSYTVEDAEKSLSYGERNALSLIFFAHSMIGKKPDLIILDDPITSFDGSKRFAILDMLFLRKRDEGKEKLPPPATLKGKTVILLTHDYGVVFEIEHTLKSKFSPLATTYHLHTSAGCLKETILAKDDMQPVRKLYAKLAKQSDDSLIKYVYTRRLLELSDEKSEAWDILSSLFHHRDNATLEDGSTPLSPSQIALGTKTIEELTDATFDYHTELARISDLEEMLRTFDSCCCNYEKLQIARIALDKHVDDCFDSKTLSETVHVDNGYLWQLDPRKFEEIPNRLVKRYRTLMTEKLSDTEASL